MLFPVLPLGSPGQDPMCPRRHQHARPHFRDVPAPTAGVVAHRPHGEGEELESADVTARKTLATGRRINQSFLLPYRLAPDLCYVLCPEGPLHAPRATRRSLQTWDGLGTMLDGSAATETTRSDGANQP